MNAGPISGEAATDRSMALEQEFEAFSYNVSHDVAASFRLVGEFSRLLLGDLGDGLTERQDGYARHIRAAADNGQAMIEQLVVFSRVQRTLVKKVRHDATSVARLCLLRLDAQIREADGDVTLESLGEIDADPELMAPALHHLLDNAIKFRRPDVPLRIHVRPNHDDETWRIRIQDNGRGVEPGYRQKAFEMFRRQDAASPGVGAGLAICRRIARRQDGDVAFLDCSEGACIELTLPRTPPAC